MNWAAFSTGFSKLGGIKIRHKTEIEIEEAHIMKTLSATVVIHVTDLERAISYYTDVLGFTQHFKLANYAGLFLDHVSIHLSAPDNPGMKKLPGNAHLCIEIDEADAYFNMISLKGGLITVPLADRYYGMRDFAVNDHDGNTLVFGSVMNSALN